MTGCCTELDPEALDKVGEAILARIASFGQLLRKHDYAVGLKEQEDAAAIARSLPGNRTWQLRNAFRSLYCSRASDWKTFDALFDSHWLGRGVRQLVMKVGGSSASSLQKALAQQASDGFSAGDVQSLADELSGEAGEAETGSTGKSEGASRAETLSTTDFRKIADPEALAAAHRAAERLGRVMRTKLNRRTRSRSSGRLIDMPATIRGNVSHGGVPIELAFRKRKERPLRIVMLLDASGSMQMYTAVFTRFMHGMLDAFGESEAFVFHTRLAHVSEAMKEKNATRAVERMSLMSQGVGGGTRIGECLATFNQWHARRVLNSRSCIMILSDGYDTGDPARLAGELARLRKRCKRIIWLNPMMGWQGFAPEARALKAALPFVDAMLPAHNLESLQALETELSRL